MKIDVGLAFLRRYWLWCVVAFFAVLHIFIFTRVFQSIDNADVELYFNYASNIMSGQIPYRDFTMEYPPGALLVFLLPRLFASTLEVYGPAFALTMLAFDLACLFMIISLARRLKLAVVPTLIIYSLVVISVGSIGVQRFDFAPAALSLAAVFAFGRGNYKSSWALVAVGTLIKLYPIALAPLFLIYQWRHQPWRSIVAPVLVCGAVLVCAMLPFFVLSPSGFTNAFSLQSGRNLQIESFYASLLFMSHALGGSTVAVFFGPVSWDMTSRYAAGIASISLVAMFFAAATVYYTYFLPYRWKQAISVGPPEPPALGRLVNFSLLLVIVLLMTSKVVSTQFIVWLLPFVPLVSGRARHAVWPIFIVAGLLTWYIYPLHYGDLYDLYVLPMQALFLRNIILIIIAFWLWEAREPELGSEEMMERLLPNCA
ncbi:MAG: DUF2029 domain-containing protein [Dehalococcoidia bacterium]|nr:DUF2029 domain-containing protein [Dehalococcoidia bacterium]